MQKSGTCVYTHENPSSLEWRRSRDSFTESLSAGLAQKSGFAVSGADSTDGQGETGASRGSSGSLQTMIAMQVYLQNPDSREIKKSPKGLVCLAQKSGFEPEVAFTTPAFQASTLDRSDTSA